jgi:hypothetical protein
MRFAFGMLVTVSLLGPVTSAAYGDCKTAYRTACVETDTNGRCTRYERHTYELCTGGNGAGRGSKACYECTEFNSDGSCKKTRKVKC